ncbi:MAG TPA: hypothetical protein VFS08_17035 [Gemmatimonadaceae bacterium]|nr:hypothetical protein [Gemmatimonadaceae bacterium]
MLRVLSRAALLVALVASPAAAQWGRGRDYTAERSATIRTAGASRIGIQAHAGSLRIEGRSGLTEVRAHGTARASSREILESVRLRADRSGSAVTIVVETPERLRDDDWAALDLVVEVPRDLPLTVDDGSGDTEVRDVGALELRDGSGGILVDGVNGSLRLVDGSGELRVRGVRGDVEIEDGSGEMDVRDVRGSVRIEDGSGELEIRDVGRDVVLARKGSGDVTVTRVGGDLVAGRSLRRRLSYSEIEGRVDVPGRDRE